MSPLLHRQPYKALYVLFASLHLLLVLLPTWTLQNCIPSWRPFPTWTLSRALCVSVLRWGTDLFFRINRFNRRDLSVGASEEELEGTEASFVWVPAVDRDLGGQVGQWVKETGTRAIRLPAYWLGEADSAGRRDYRAAEKEKVLVRFHGGAYIVGSAYPTEIGTYIPSQLCARSVTLGRALSVEYRLSSSAPNAAMNAFPAALVDAISAFNYVLSLGFEPSNIYLTGGSAGANLALALTRYLVDNDLPPPGGLILFSPWTDMTDSHLTPTSSYVRNERTDFCLGLENKLSPYAMRSYLGGIPPSNPYISPASKLLEPAASFVGFPRTYIVAGGGEMLLDEIRTLREFMDGQVEAGVTYDEVYGAIHDFCVFWFMQPEREETMRKVAKWIDEG